MSFNLFFILAHNFSIGFKSGEYGSTEKLGYTRKKTDKIQGAGREKSKCIFKKIIRSKFRQRNNLY